MRGFSRKSESRSCGSVSGIAVVGTGHAFLNDIAHNAAPALVDPDRNPFTIITLSDASPVWVAGVRPNDFTAEDFIFG
jgi:hypothetical protein